MINYFWKQFVIKTCRIILEKKCLLYLKKC